MLRRKAVALAVLAVLVISGFLYLPALYRRVVGLRHMPLSGQEERRAAIEPPISTPTDVPSKAELFWESKSAPGTIIPAEVELKLSADPVERAKQLLAALIAGPADPTERTLPPDATLEEFYLLPEGTAVADFSSELSTHLPSGIQSEEMAVESIAGTLAANIPDLHRLKILIGGQEAETLAGHIDLTGYFLLPPPALAATSVSPPAPSLPH